MSAKFKTLSSRQFSSSKKIVPEHQQYWRNYEFPVTKREPGAVSSVSICPVPPFNIAVTSSAQIQIYNGQTFGAEKKITRFKSMAFGASYREDGELLVCGDKDGEIRVISPSTKSVLRQFSGHTSSVRATRFTASNKSVISGSDDKTVRVWDISSTKDSQLRSYTDHQDFVRCVHRTASPDIFLSGSYDHTVKMYDSRLEKSVLTIDHGLPVESILVFPSGNVAVSAGGCEVKIWDLLYGGRLLSRFDPNPHIKTVTSLAFAAGFSSILTASLDKMVKVHDVVDYQVIHSMEYSAPVLSLAVSRDDGLLVTGTHDGLLNIKRRRPPKDPTERKPPKRKRNYVVGPPAYMPSPEDSVIVHEKKAYLAKYEKHLKAFDYSKALAEVIKSYNPRKPERVVGMLRELIRRRGLSRALARTADSHLCRLVTFVSKNIYRVEFFPVLADVTNTLLDEVARRSCPSVTAAAAAPTPLNSNSELFTSLIKLQDCLTHERQLIHELKSIEGVIDLLNSNLHNSLESESVQVKQSEEKTTVVIKTEVTRDSDNEKMDINIGRVIDPKTGLNE